MKRAIAFVSALCMLIAFLPAAATAETYENLTYSVSGGEAVITDCSADVSGALTIPETIGGYPVTAIGVSAFADCAGLTEITIGAQVTNIESGAFAGCSELTAITVAEGNPVYHSVDNCLVETSSKTLIAGCRTSLIPTDGSVIAIGRLAFYKCAGLTAVTLPDCVLSVGVSAFEACTGLETVDLGDGVTSIGNNAFLDCVALTAVEIPDSVTAMGVYVFSGCTALTAVALGDGLETIGNSVFSGCTALTDVTIGSGVMTIEVFAFSGCSSLDEIVIHEGVTAIGKFAFYNCGRLTGVSVPASVNSIGKNAFSGCDDVKLVIPEENTYAISYALNNGISYVTTGLGSLAVTTVSLRPGAAGIYFGSSLDWAADHSEVASYGIAVSTSNPLPVADGSDAASLYTQGSTSVLIEGIMKTGNDTDVNASNAKADIYARVYVQKTDGEYLYSEAVSVDLQRVVIAVQSKWDKLTDTQKSALAAMYATYESVMSSWDVPNLQ